MGLAQSTSDQPAHGSRTTSLRAQGIHVQAVDGTPHLLPLSGCPRCSPAHRAVLGFVPCERLAAECRHPTGREKIGSPTQTLRNPILALPWVCFRVASEWRLSKPN